MKSEQLIAWRKASGLSREKAAKLLGCSTISVRRYETGESPIPEKIVAATLSMGKAENSGIELAPPHDRASFLSGGWDTPQNSPRLWWPTKKGWDRLPPGAPLHPVGTNWVEKINRDKAAMDAEQQALDERLAAAAPPDGVYDED